ncbi:MAG: T9SS type A sorting domain-containing protein [Bacteroidetes bacterium]|nr:T9SS type A sorting domain-containing protein [Bacteroidota bacterium]
MHPNPASDKISITFSNSSKPFTLEVYNNTALKLVDMSGIGSLDLITSSWPRGLYSFVLTQNGNALVKK